ncbi:hypothetical protein ACX3O0_05870 [Homoserinimonas sp. A447]
MLFVAASLMAALGIAHSILGERYIITWLLRHDLPKLFGGSDFAAGTIRFAWHITTVLALGFAAVLALIALHASESAILAAVGWTLIACGLLPIYFTRGRHLSWIVFFAAGALCLLATL